jgi:hypothetical protein
MLWIEYAAPYVRVPRRGLTLVSDVAQRGHAHYLARDGEWCVTAAQVGMLWEHLRRAGERTS